MHGTEEEISPIELEEAVTSMSTRGVLQDLTELSDVIIRFLCHYSIHAASKETLKDMLVQEHSDNRIGTVA